MRPNESEQKNAVKREIAQRIKDRREYLKRTRGGYTVEDVAEQFARLRGVPISRVGYNKYETGDNEIAVSDLVFIAEVLGTTPEYLLGVESAEESQDDDFIAWYRAQPAREKMTLQAWRDALERYRSDDADESLYGKTDGKRAE